MYNIGEKTPIKLRCASLARDCAAIIMITELGENKDNNKKIRKENTNGWEAYFYNMY